MNGIVGATYLGSPGFGAGASTTQHETVETAKQSPRMEDNQRALLLQGLHWRIMNLRVVRCCVSRIIARMVL